MIQYIEIGSKATVVLTSTYPQTKNTALEDAMGPCLPYKSLGVSHNGSKNLRNIDAFTAQCCWSLWKFCYQFFRHMEKNENAPNSNNSLIGECWENPWDGGPLIINPICTLYSGYILGISPFKGLLGVVKQLGYRVPLSQGYHHFPYDKQPTNRHFQATKRLLSASPTKFGTAINHCSTVKPVGL